ncbi:MAG: ATP-binding protein [Faecalibacterium sp.]|nr:ATP-binding protein [Ruminococcus sp.]MCM1392605.1 ATP-binding protein [Ruminococcus sp.]MCM1486526.1 ATP-binding protein [Faecalibacterium sp.]
MKKFSIRTKLVIWFSLLLLIIMAITLSIMLAVSNNVLNTDVKDSLLVAVTQNTEEIEYMDDVSLSEHEPGDHFVKFNSGFLEIDDDFLDNVNGISCALYDTQGNLLYGENIIRAPITEDGKIHAVKFNGERYYTYCYIFGEGELDGLILQGVVDENAKKTTLSRILNISLLLLPILSAIAIAGGYISAGRSLKPVKQINNDVSSITDGNDLSKRIDVGNGNDEIHQLADTFNKMLARLESSFEDEKQFTADISHELRTPVSAILAQSELALEKDRTTEEYKKALSLIERQSIRMKNIIEDMLRFSRLERLETLDKAEEIDLSMLVESVCEEQAARTEKGITLSYNIEPEISMSANTDMMIRLLNNLISNAYRYGKENGHIKVSLKQDGCTALLEVSDDGIGISEKDKEKIFERFYQSDKARTASKDSCSIGLGLSTVRKIAHLHCGTVSVNSTENEGSTFIVAFQNKEESEK